MRVRVRDNEIQQTNKEERTKREIKEKESKREKA
jgi:hypothetical protein